jgi:hypothetical protein
LPESFRGGCSFGAGTEADLSRRDALEQIGWKHDWAKAVNAAAVLSTVVLVQQAYDPLAQFLDTAICLV